MSDLNGSNDLKDPDLKDPDKFKEALIEETPSAEANESFKNIYDKYFGVDEKNDIQVDDDSYNEAVARVIVRRKGRSLYKP